MRRLLLILGLCLLPVSCWGASLIGSGVAASGGGTPTTIVDITPSASTYKSTASWTVGQAFPATADKLHSLIFYIQGNSSSTTFTVRIGTNSDLSTYTEELTGSYTATGNGSGDLDPVTCTSSSQPTLSTGTWYVAVHSSVSVNICVDDNNSYADGVYHYASGSTSPLEIWV